MMPRLDGFDLLRALRAAPSTSTLTIILLSARAGEESRVEGLERGAGECLVKPFSARELLARGGANLDMARTRMDAAEKVAAANAVLADHTRQLEMLVAERTAKLQESVAELEAFAYSVSHDMRAPLRAMQSFGRLLQEDCGESLSAEG